MIEELLYGALGEDFKQIHSEVKELLSQIPEEKFDEIMKTKGPEGVLQYFAEEVLFKEEREALKEKLREYSPYMGILSDEIEEHFLDRRARSIMKVGASLQGSRNDCLGENIDNAIANFDLESKILLPDSVKAPEIQKFMSQLQRPENEIVGEFLMRQTPEHLKLLMYFAKVKSVNDLKRIFDRFEEQKDAIRESIGHRGYNGDHMGMYLNKMTKHPVEFMDALGGRRLEDVLTKTNVSSVDDFNKLLLDTPYMAPFLVQVDPEIFNSVVDMKNVSSVDDLVNLTRNKAFRDSLPQAGSEGDFSKNVVRALKYFKVSELDDMEALLELEKTSDVMKRASKGNFQTLLDVSEVESISDLEMLCNNGCISNHIGSANYEALSSLFINLGLEGEDLRGNMYEMITHSYTKKVSEHVVRLDEIASQKQLSARLQSVMMPILQDEDYVEQNLETIIQLVEQDVLETDEAVDKLDELKGLMGGFVTPELSKKYIAAKNDTEKKDVMETYQRMMSQVLSSDAIDIEDPGLLSEIIYLAYRPTGYSIGQIQEMVSGWGRSLEDLTHHLDNINFDESGYSMNFFHSEREQLEEYDSTLLHSIDNPLFVPTKNKKLAEIIRDTLSAKPKHMNNLPTLFGHVLVSMGDDRILEYRESHHSDKGVSQEYSEQRLEGLVEILGIIPKEGQFFTALGEILGDKEYASIAKTSADRYLWQRRKAQYTPAQRDCKSKIDEAIKHLSKDIDSDVSMLLTQEQILSLGEETVIELNSLNGYDLLTSLTQIKEKRFLGYGEEGAPKDYTEVYHNAILDHSKRNNSKVRKEMRKVQAVKSENSSDVVGVVSKNVGSYFAKAGAEICTSHNMRMWNEDRHAHLNIVHNNQIIGNVMLYFEPERDYMVARGFNPRRDTMERFDRYSMATEIVGVLEQIARVNGYREIFVPEQTAWHALSNRDGMAKEVIGISRKNSKIASERDPNQRTVIDDANFYVTEMGGTSMNRLNLLSIV